MPLEGNGRSRTRSRQGCNRLLREDWGNRCQRSSAGPRDISRLLSYEAVVAARENGYQRCRSTARRPLAGSRPTGGCVAEHPFRVPARLHGFVVTAGSPPIRSGETWQGAMNFLPAPGANARGARSRQRTGATRGSTVRPCAAWPRNANHNREFARSRTMCGTRKWSRGESNPRKISLGGVAKWGGRTNGRT